MRATDRHVPSPIAVIVNMLLLYVAYMVTRVAFYFENHSVYEHLAGNIKIWDIFCGGLYFDTSAIAYTNALYLVLVLLPWTIKETAVWQHFCKWLYMVVNGIGIAINLCDAVYFQYTARRTTIAFFSEFGADDKLGRIIGLEFLRHWYLVLLFVIIIALLYRCYLKPRPRTSPRVWYYITQTISLSIALVLCWAGMRGSFGDNRPININTANQFIVRPNDASLILNTPFTILRTIGKHPYVKPDYYQDPVELESIFSPIHSPQSAHHSSPTHKNIVIIILESFGREYIGSLNKDILADYKGYTPFLDSLIAQSVTFRHTYSNGKSSIDAMPSTLSGLPMFVESFVASTHANNQLGGMAACLNTMGYQTAFFHGAPASSLGFQSFTKATGFQQCWSQEDFEADSRTEGRAASDNWWGIWDEPFLQYFRIKMTDMKQPFMTALFTLTSHHPFHVPGKYKEMFPEEEMPIHKCIRYTDHALKLFFKEAAKEPWFKNTVFVLTGDHTNMSNHAEYKSSINQFSVPVIIYDASHSLKPGMRNSIAQQTDIMPTILNLTGYNKPYMAFGCDLLNTPDNDTWAVNYIDGIYQYCKNGYVLQFDGKNSIGLYTLTDYRMHRNLLGKVPLQPSMERELKAVIQQYMNRIINNQLLP